MEHTMRAGSWEPLIKALATESWRPDHLGRVALTTDDQDRVTITIEDRTAVSEALSATRRGRNQ